MVDLAAFEDVGHLLIQSLKASVGKIHGLPIFFANGILPAFAIFLRVLGLQCASAAASIKVKDILSIVYRRDRVFSQVSGRIIRILLRRPWPARWLRIIQFNTSSICACS